MDKINKPQPDTLSLKDALLEIKSKSCKFDESIDVVINLSNVGKVGKDGVVARGSVKAPFGLKRKLVIAAFCDGDNTIEGADYVGGEDLITQFKSQPKMINKIDLCVAHPKYIQKVSSQLGKMLGRRRIMPDARYGTISENIQLVIDNYRFGVINFRANKNIIHAAIGNISSTVEELESNFNALATEIQSVLPSIKFASIYVSSTMGVSKKVRC